MFDKFRRQNNRCGFLQSVWMLFFVLLVATPYTANAQWSGTFEPPKFVGNTAGIGLNGQGGFFNPDPGTSVSAEVYQYVGNTLGIAQNPTGGTQFVASEGPAGMIYSRSELAVQFDDGTGMWMISFDINVVYTGVLPSTQNIGSFAPREDIAGVASFISLATWQDPNTATNWNADYVWFDCAGYQLQEQVANSAFQNLSVNHWYRWTTIVDFDTNRIVEAAITDLGTGLTTRQLIASRYMYGGAVGTPPPVGFRLFGGSATTPGNTVAWDNIMVSRPQALVFQDAYQWNELTIQKVLTKLAVSYDLASSPDMATIDLGRYTTVIVPSNQGGPFYSLWNASVARVENFVAGGGRLWQSTCAQSFTVPEPLVPGGVNNQNDLDYYNVLVDPDHPWVIGVVNPMYGNYASHESFTNLYPGSHVVAESQATGLPTLVEYWMGDGVVFLTGQTLEVSAAYGWDGTPILENSISDLLGWLIFSNGFDSGGLGGWSTMVP